MNRSWILALLFCAACASSAPMNDQPFTPTKAEYAIRWFPKDGGPKSAAAVLTVLDLPREDPEAYEVRYFDFDRPPMPKDFTSILRLRKKMSSNKNELTFKVRGDYPIDHAWSCPLDCTAGCESKDEVDIAFLNCDSFNRVYSRSCTAETAEPPPVLKAKPAKCSASMRRIKSGGLKVEEWLLPQGSVIEVSGNGTDTIEALEKFRREVVAKLLKAKIVPSGRSKTDLGTDCN